MLYYSIPHIKNSRYFQLLTVVIIFAYCSQSLIAQNEKIGDISDGSRTTPTHIIKLIDQDSSAIWLDESPLMPFSTEKTCGICHDYAKISTGWHFNAGDSTTEDGRRGQPWIYVNPYSATQLPISLRQWYGTFRPNDIGISTFQFISIFGRHMPGGGAGENKNKQSGITLLEVRTRKAKRG